MNFEGWVIQDPNDDEVVDNVEVAVENDAMDENVANHDDAEVALGNDAMDVDAANHDNADLIQNDHGQYPSDDEFEADSDFGDLDQNVFIADFGDLFENFEIPVPRPIQPTFNLNVDGNLLDTPLRTAEEGAMRKHEFLVLNVAKCLGNKETYKSLIDTFKIANLTFEGAEFPKNMRDFWKLFERQVDHFTHKVVCTVCWFEWEGKEPTREPCTCGRCGPGLPNADLGTYLYLDLIPQFQAMLSKRGTATDFFGYRRDRAWRNRADGVIEDVFDGEVYRHLTQPGEFLQEGSNNGTLTVWIDGISPVKTNNIQVVPVFVQRNEQNPRARQSNSMLAAVYVGPAKPDTPKFMLPVTRQLQYLYNHGIRWWTDDNVEILSRFIVLILSADSEERYKILGMTWHNGHWGCTFCYVDGVPNDEGHRRLIYTTERETHPDARDRTDEEIRADSEEAHRTRQRVHGVKRVAALYPLEIDLRTSQLVEGLHCFWQGNSKRLKKNLLSELPAGDIATINARILSIRTPTKLSRAPRSLTDFAKFTATEYRNNTWFYWLPCAHEFLIRRNADGVEDDSRLRLCANFAEATFILNKDSITPVELERAETLLTNYRVQFRNVFAQEQSVFNVHLLKHAARSVRELGPSWVASGFWFESLNRRVVNYLTGPTDRAWQVACRLLLGQFIEKCLEEMEFSPGVLSLLREFVGREKWDEPPDVATGAYVQIREARDGEAISPYELQALERALPGGIPEPGIQITYRHKKVCLDGIIYQEPKDYVTKYNNSIAYINRQNHLPNVDFIAIHSIVTLQPRQIGEEMGVFGTAFRTTGEAFNLSYMKTVERIDELVYVDIGAIVLPGVLVQPVEDGPTYISRLPNKWDND